MKIFNPASMNPIWRISFLAALFLLSACVPKHAVTHAGIAEIPQTPAQGATADGGAGGNADGKKSSQAEKAVVNPGSPSTVSTSDAHENSSAAMKPMSPERKTSSPSADVPESGKVEKAADINLEVLTERLKETPAIGVFTKLAIRSDILDLKDEIQGYKQKSMLQAKLDYIRAKFDGLLIKIMALLEADPKLSRDLYSARESIWKSLLGVHS